jgi:hypothetical protein
VIKWSQDKERQHRREETEMLNETIKAIESKGYIVKASENRWLGELDEACPEVYEILNSDYSEVYGANGISPEGLADWLDLLAPVGDEGGNIIESVWDAAKEDERKANEKAWDDTYNEGAEGYNPYRESTKERKIKFWMASDNTKGQEYTADTNLTDIIDIAYKFGRAESNEIIERNGERAGWDSQYRKYRRQLSDGRWQ